MDNNQNQPFNQPTPTNASPFNQNPSAPAYQPVAKKNPTLKVVTPIAIVIIAGLVIWLSNKPPTAVLPTDQKNAAQLADSKKYKDGTYQAVGNYQSPESPETVNLSLTLSQGMVKSAQVQGGATGGNSQRWQDRFIAGFSDQVVGQPIDQINLTVVNGSSLTPIGFMDALAKIKSQAQI